MAYSAIINEIDPTVNARHVEASMRAEYGTLCHLPRETFDKIMDLSKAGPFDLYEEWKLK